MAEIRLAAGPLMRAHSAPEYMSKGQGSPGVRHVPVQEGGGGVGDGGGGEGKVKSRGMLGSPGAVGAGGLRGCRGGGEAYVGLMGP